MIPNGSGSAHGWPTPGPAGEKQLEFGGAAMTTSSAAQRRVCSPFGFFAARVTWFIALVFLFATASAAAPRQNTGADASSPASTVLFSASFDYATGKDVIEGLSSANTQATAQQQQFVIDRIDFLGNRRVRSDTLSARIFSRKGDVYNEETLRRDFQALWNTQFFEDVKLRVEDSPNNPNGKIIVFDVKERPQIRRIRYDGTHSASQSPILTRSTKPKAALTLAT